MGVVASPGLEIVAQYYDIGQERAEQATSAVFGSRRDLINLFGNDAIHLLQLDIADGVRHKPALAEIRKMLAGTLLTVGSGQEIKDSIESIGRGSMKVMSVVAVAALLIACFGVGSVVIAGVESRQFEFGVLRAVGAPGSLLTRLVLAEVIIICLAACALGIGLGLQGAWTGQVHYRMLAGLELRLIPQWLPIGAGCLIVFALALGAAAPAALRLARRKPRELLAATRG